MNTKLTNEIIDERIKHKSFIRIDNYGGRANKLKWFCKIHNLEFYEYAHNILNGYTCPSCSKSKKLSNEIVDERLKSKNIKRIGQYINNNTKIKVECTSCSYTWETKPYVLFSKNNHGCPNCNKCAKITNNIIDERIKNRNILRIENSCGSNKKILFKCLLCSNEWKTEPNYIMNMGYGCPLCATSKGEKYIDTVIEKYKGLFSYFKRHEKIIINNKKLYVDFFIVLNNKIIIIEYNGIQHYKPTTFNGITKDIAKLKYEKQTYRDNMLRQHCLNNNILYIEIPYNMKINDINNILKDKIEEYK